MVKKIALAVAALVVGFVVVVLGLASTKPDAFKVERSATINAKPEAIYPLIANFHKWDGWSPWEKLDPQMKRTFEGPESGKGAVYAWAGDGKVGRGRMEIVEATPPTQVTIKLEFFEPMEGHNPTTFTLTPSGDATTVNWRMEGPMPFMSKVMCVFMDMEKMIGPDFERGLASMKSLAETK